MKKTYLFYVLSVLTLLITGCQTTNDTALTLDSFKEKATIKGNVFYNLGQNLSANNYIIEQRLAAKGKTVYLDVAASEYQPGATGLITFQSVIDSSGNYSFTIPVKTQGLTNATLRLEEFTANRKVYDKMSNGVPQFTTQPVVFSCSEAIAVSKGKLLVDNLNYSFTPVDVPNTYNEYIRFTGSVNISYESAFKEGSIKAASGKSVEVAVSYPELGQTLNFGTAVDQNGNYSIMIPVKSKSSPITASFQAVGYYSTDYTHYVTSSSNVTLRGIYGSNSQQNVSTNSGVGDKVEYTVNPILMRFNPDITPPTFTYYLAGWTNAELKTDPAKTYYPITLKGTVLAAYEKSYLTGDYLPITQKTDTVTVSVSNVSKTYIVATDDNGNFTLPLLLPSNNMDISITEKPEKFGLTNFYHYLYDGTSVQLSGWYKTNYYDINNRTLSINEFSTVYTLDNLYRKFTPTDITNIIWYDNLIGWYQIPGKKGVVNLTGGIKEAVEGAPITSKPSAWANPTWAVAPNYPFTITIAGQSFKSVTNSSGQYSLPYPVNVPTSNLTVSLTTFIATVANFNHYSDINATPVAIQGSYSGTVSSASFSVVNGSCLIKDCYMFFTPSTNPTGWNFYTWTAN